METLISPISLFVLLLPIVAFLYASVGHGGASGYLALMGLFGFLPAEMKPTALLLNLFVAGISFAYYFKAGHFNKRLFLSFAVTSIPCAFVGGMISVDPFIYKKLLAVLLIVAILRMLGVFGKESDETRAVQWFPAMLAGAGIGFISGLIGIGGGIILTPLILLLRWGRMKEAAAVSALFIWVNSAAGIAGQWSTGIIFPDNAWLWVALAILGGAAGSYWGSKKWGNGRLTQVLALVLAIASAKLLLL